MSLRPSVVQVRAMQASIWSTTAVAFVFLVLRFWARIYKRAIGIDDGIMLLSWLLFLACTSVTSSFIANTGDTKETEHLTPVEIEQLLKMAVIDLPMSIAVTSLGKIAIGVTILRIIGNASTGKKWYVWAMLMLLITVSVVSIFVGLFRCGAPQNQWDLARLATAKCLPNNVYKGLEYLTIAVQTFSDFFFSVLSMVVVWKLNMNLRRKITIMFLLSLTLVTGAVAIVKLVAQIHFSSTNLFVSVYKIALLFSLEAMFIIVFGSMPVLNPLWGLCIEIRQSIKGSGVIRSSKGFSIGSSNKQTTGQGSNIGTAPHDSKGMQDSDSELARLTGYPEQPVVFVHGGRESKGHPQESDVFGHYGGGFQDERWSSNQMPGSIRVQHQVYQKITSQHNTHGTHGY